MEKDDVELIRHILNGDDSAFSDIVNKYQKSVHALVWRKIGNFQVAEEIAQDTFLQAYKKLATLKTPSQFAGWLYVIASNLCSDWHRRKKPTMQSLDATNKGTLDATSYECYVAEQREKAAIEYRREIVKKLLNKLPESERTVVTLHYLGEMTSEAISKFLGVSVNTIKSRLRRARKRLQKEEPMIRETLGTINLPVNFTEKIMEQITNITPTPTSSGKPLIPMAALGAATILVLLLFGGSYHYLSRIQQPYSIESVSETAVEIVDASVLLDIQLQPDLRRRIGNVVDANRNSGPGQQESDNALIVDTDDDISKETILTHQWTQARGPQGGRVDEIFQSSEGEIFAVSSTGIYKTTKDETEWVLLNNTILKDMYFRGPMAERKNILYIVSTDEIFASTDDGVTWNSIGSRPRGSVIGFLITDSAFYLVMDDEIFRSTDEGEQWLPFNNGLEDREITTAASIGSTLFVGTNRGVYRLHSDTWEQLPLGIFKKVNSLTVSGNTVYVGLIPGDSELGPEELKKKLVREIFRKENSTQWELFRSDDLGGTWTKITPKNRSMLERIPFGIKVLVTDNTIWVFGVNTYRSEDNGITWRDLGSSLGSVSMSEKAALAIDKDTFYTHGFNGIQRSTDAGESWHPFMEGMVGTNLEEIISFNDKLYLHSQQGIYQSTDTGKSWKKVQIESDKFDFILSVRPYMTLGGNSLYGIARDKNEKVRLCSISSDGEELIPIPGIPAIEIDPDLLNKNLSENSTADDISTRQDVIAERVRLIEDVIGTPKIGGLAITGNTYYVAYNQRLLKWTSGDSKWKDTGLDTGDSSYYYGFSLAALGKTVYLGRKDGKLFHSSDAGISWNDITNKLPLEFKEFKEIRFVGSTVFVATDKGVLTSNTGENWQLTTDEDGKNSIFDSIVVDKTQVFGGNKDGIYQLDNSKWLRISPEIPGRVRDFEIHNDKFYVVTDEHGMFHIPVEHDNR